MADVIDIVIPTYGKSEYTMRCLGSLAFDGTPPHRVVWVDNGSDEHDYSAVAAMMRQTDISVKIPGPAGHTVPVNIGLRYSQFVMPFTPPAKWILILNNDVEFGSSDALINMVQVLKDNPAIGAVGPACSEGTGWQSITNIRSKLKGLGLPEGFSFMSLSERSKAMSGMHRATACDVSSLAFFCAMLRSEAVRSLGPLDETIGQGYGDDDDYCIRLKRAGWKLAVAPGAYVFHNHGTTFTARFRAEEITAMKKTARKAIEDRIHGR